jgi:tetratricopeptide (TPR) repeat protein
VKKLVMLVLPRLLMAGTLIVSACARQETSWQADRDAGREAHRARRYHDAEKKFTSALEKLERSASDTEELADSLDDLASVHGAQRAFDKAEPLRQRALEVRKKLLGESHKDVAASADRLASVYVSLRKLDEAALLYERSLAIYERATGPLHKDVAAAIDRLAGTYVRLRRFDDAAALYARALTIREKTAGMSSGEVASSLDRLAALHVRNKKVADAEPLYLRALAIREQISAEEAIVAGNLTDLAKVYVLTKRYGEAESLYHKAVSLLEKSVGVDHPALGEVLDDYANLLREMRRRPEADTISNRARAIRAKKVEADRG